jgi:UDP-N-acetylmuramoyl-tripeptide--D-alanyl-D-alanine ligase
VSKRRLLRELAAAYLWIWARLVLVRRQPRIIGVTGSVGKTTTKELLVEVLKQPEASRVLGSVGESAGNLNADIGVPLSVLRLSSFPYRDLKGLVLCMRVPFRAISLAFFRRYPNTLVLEYGAGSKGDIAHNARRARPEVGIVTAIGPAHLGTFGSVKGVAEAKQPLITNVPANGLVVLGRENPYLDQMRKRASAPVVEVGGRGSELSAEIARAVARHFGIEEAAVDRALESFRGVHRRLALSELGDILLIDDSYNANPLSMKYGLERLGAYGSSGRRVAILGWMAELGPEELRYHEEMASSIAANCDLVVGVGELAKAYAPDRWFPDSAGCAAEVGDIVRPGDVVLLKGSNSVELWKIARALKRRTETAGPIAG